MSVFDKLVFPESIAGGAKLVANITLVSWGLHMVGLNVNINVCLHFGCFAAVIALPFSSGILAHLRKDQRLQI